jgi:hypothetical protein
VLARFVRNGRLIDALHQQACCALTTAKISKLLDS